MRAAPARRRAGIILLSCKNSETCNKKEKTPFHDHLEYLPIQNPQSGRGLGFGGRVHIDLLTPLLSTMERLRPELNVPSMVGNHTLLLWLQRGGVTPLARSSRAPLRLLTHTPRRNCLQQPPLAGRIAYSHTTSVSFRFAFRVTPHGVPNPMYVSVWCLPWPLPLYSSFGE